MNQTCSGSGQAFITPSIYDTQYFHIQSCISGFAQKMMMMMMMMMMIWSSPTDTEPPDRNQQIQIRHTSVTHNYWNSNIIRSM